MSWVRVEDTAPENPKLLLAGAAASWLWICGLCYCQRQLTDGFISDAALRVLCFPDPLDTSITQLVDVGLWKRVEGGYRVHDYLDYNLDRQTALARRDADRDRKRKNGRMGGLAKAANRNPTGIQSESDRIPLAPSHPIPSPIIKKRTTPEALTEGVRDAFNDPVITERAGRFLDSYQDLYEKYLHAHYVVHPQRDYVAAVQLCSNWPDDRLQQLVIVFLNSNLKFIEEGTRTVPHFLSMASWCDTKLAAAEGKAGKKATG